MKLLLSSSMTTNISRDGDEHAEAREHGERQHDRERRRDPRADVRDEPQHGAQQPPQHEAGERLAVADEVADQPQPDRDRDAVRAVHDRLRQQVAADARGGVVERLRRDV